MSHSQDRKLIATKQSKGGEVKYVARTKHVPIKILRIIMVALGKNGKPTRSRSKVDNALLNLGYGLETLPKDDPINDMLDEE